MARLISRFTSEVFKFQIQVSANFCSNQNSDSVFRYDDYPRLLFLAPFAEKTKEPLNQISAQIKPRCKVQFNFWVSSDVAQFVFAASPLFQRLFPDSAKNKKL